MRAHPGMNAAAARQRHPVARQRKSGGSGRAINVVGGCLQLRRRE